MYIYKRYISSSVYIYLCVCVSPILTQELTKTSKRNGIHKSPLISLWSNHELGSDSELELTSNPEFWACYWSMLGVVWSAEKPTSGSSHRFLYSVKRHNETKHQRPHGKPPSEGMEHHCPRTLRRRSHSQRLCGLWAWSAPTLHNRMPGWFEEMPPAADGKYKEEDWSSPGDSLGLTSFF